MSQILQFVELEALALSEFHSCSLPSMFFSKVPAQNQNLVGLTLCHFNHCWMVLDFNIVLAPILVSLEYRFLIFVVPSVLTIQRFNNFDLPFRKKPHLEVSKYKLLARLKIILPFVNMNFSFFLCV